MEHIAGITLIVATVFIGLSAMLYASPTVAKDFIRSMLKVIRIILGVIFVAGGTMFVGQWLTRITPLTGLDRMVTPALAGLVIIVIGLLLLRLLSKRWRLSVVGVALFVTALSSIPLDSYTTKEASIFEMGACTGLVFPEAEHHSILLGDGRAEMEFIKRTGPGCYAITHRLYIL